jgi:hypothetical protein
LKWLQRANVHFPVVLKNVFIQDTHTHIPVGRISKISLFTKENMNTFVDNLGPVTEISKEMKQGRRTVKKLYDTANPKLLLTHGYCADENPWKHTQDIWTNPIYFEDLEANIDNQAFAQKLLAFATESGATSFGVIAHSQGGLATITLLNYFQTVMDDAEGPRLIQSVGSPYHGSSGAGSAANLADMFGIACGSNFDLSLDGAKLWLSGITEDTQKQVYYYTTTYGTGGTLGDYCSLVRSPYFSYLTSDLAYQQRPRMAKRWRH